MDSKFTRETLAVQAMGKIDPHTRAVVLPLHVSTTYIRDPDNLYRSGFSYGRADNETVRELEAVVAALEGASDAMAFGSGMSAAIAVFLALPSGSRVVAPTVMYWALKNWLIHDAPGLGLIVSFVDMTDPQLVATTIAEAPTQVVWVETPSNPLWGIVDIASIAEIARKAGARLVVDSTCATPVLTQPLALGADIVMHSATKYLNGHSDAIAGVLATSNKDAFWSRVSRIRSSHGLLLGPFEAFLVIRGMRTLHVRVRAACQTAQVLAQRFLARADVDEVLYPGLPGHPGHELASRQMIGGFGGMLSIRVKGGERAAIAAAAHVTLWKRATSLGGVESLIEHRASVEGAGSPCPPDLLRLSCGLEQPDDLYEDLASALEQSQIS